MPKLGDIRRGTDVGKKDPAKYIFCACIDCGFSRWVQWKVKEQAPTALRCKPCGQKGERGSRWKGGRRKNSDGYWYVYVKESSPYVGMAYGDHYALEHRLIMAQYLGRCLCPWEIVHHKNGIRDDNRMTNLELLPSVEYHLPSMKLQSQILELQTEILQYQRLILWLLKQNTRVPYP